MADATTTSSRYFIPALGGLYAALEPLAVPMIRVATGLLLVPHGSQKLFGWFGGDGLDAAMQGFSSMGFAPGWAVFIAILEFFGGLMLAAGLLTRLVAALVVGFMGTAVFAVHWGNGFFWTDSGFEYPLLWGIVALAFVILGGGRYSLDRAMGREL